MEADNITDEMLMDYLDGELAPEQTVQIEKACKADPELKKRLKDLQIADSLVFETIEETAASFTDEVWNKLQANTEHVPAYNFKRIFLVLLAAIGIIVGSYYNSDFMVQLDFNWFLDLSKTYLSSTISHDFQSIPLSFITQGSLFSIMIVTLLLLDRALLRPYFIRRRAELMNGQ
ncbi:hypothetical protein FNH22_22955 [Fulvivirga sp. M361]|uniref:anti-sigma factor family protein n=1 Tax=Fulvivirga sp. M361 TaxID=2594266 RepID=UPI00117B6880|nr:hypothetical protein [Fulvivirga sp. M361]TRX52035.1 hypothetical protein FNH22_22955 [Fulvivirga sp. M361]